MHVGEVQDEIPVVLVKVVFACLHVVSDHALVQGRLRFGHGLALKTCEPIYPFIDLAGKDRAVELSFLVRPVVEGPACRIQEPRGSQGQQHVLVEGHAVFVVGILPVVFAEPVGKSAGNLGDGLSRTATGKRITGISRAAACRHEKPLVLRKGPEGRFPSSGMSNHADMARIGLRRLEEYGIHVRFPKYALSGVSYPRTRQESRRPAGCTDMVFCAT